MRIVVRVTEQLELLLDLSPNATSGLVSKAFQFLDNRSAAGRLTGTQSGSGPRCSGVTLLDGL